MKGSGSVIAYYNRGIMLLNSAILSGIALLFTRIALAGIFWRSARTKIEDGTLLSISDTTTLLFSEEYGMPYPEITGHIAAYAEHVFPLLLVIGLGTRFAASGLLVMTLVIQFFVYPEAWWSVHILWVAMALVLVTHGAGIFSLDRLLAGRMR
ncbi:MAG: DoxX family protein [Parasphingorhabdus sp.]|nr:DoxX family protein [Parasphingorhabdus sp.]